jgi:hypothetical protein
MAGDWIKMRGNLWDDPRVGRIADMTDAGEAAVIGGLYWLWASADQHTEDGLMPGLSLRRIDSKTGIKGFGAALVAIGWISDHEDGIQILKFEEHNGVSAKKRCQTAKRVAAFKAGNADLGEGNAGSVTGSLPVRDLEKEIEEEKDISPSLRSGESTETAPPALPEKASKAKTLKAYLAECKAADAKPVPSDHSIRVWAEEAGVTPEMLQIAWVQFRERYTEGEKGKGKRYKDWPGHFATAVKANWFKLWFAGDTGMQWSSVGMTHKAVLDARMAQKEAEHA